MKGFYEVDLPDMTQHATCYTSLVIYEHMEPHLHLCYAGVFVTFVLAISVLVSYQEKLQAFLADLAADQSQLDSLPAEKAD